MELVAPQPRSGEGGTPGTKLCGSWKSAIRIPQSAIEYAGGHRIRVTPVPIPNTEVKPDTADGTVWETVWESRSLPALFQTTDAREPRWFAGVRVYRGSGIVSVARQVSTRGRESVFSPDSGLNLEKS